MSGAHLKKEKKTEKFTQKECYIAAVNTVETVWSRQTVLVLADQSLASSENFALYANVPQSAERTQMTTSAAGAKLCVCACLANGQISIIGSSKPAAQREE